MTYCVRVSSVCMCVLKRNGSGIELRTLDYESPDSNPELR